MTIRKDLTENENTVLSKIDDGTYLVQFDVPLNIFFLTNKETKEQYNWY